eukprot:maker-scaffold_11-snap-gene-6.6-mRNA-1 protein AED:0.23 eAED:0.23 QI:492/1/1/1/1/1/3/222/613
MDITAEVKGKLKAQIEYYLSALNLQRDQFLRNKLDESGYVNVELISGFKKVQENISLLPQSKDDTFDKIQFIIDALAESEIVETNHQEKKFKSKQYPTSQITRLILREIPETVTDQEVKEVFSGFNPESIKNEMPGFWFVDFKEENEAKLAYSALLEKTLGGKTIYAGIKTVQPQHFVQPPYFQNNNQGFQAHPNAPQAAPNAAGQSGSQNPSVPVNVQGQNVQVPGYNVYYPIPNIPMSVNPFASTQGQSGHPSAGFPLYVSAFPGYMYNPGVAGPQQMAPNQHMMQSNFSPNTMASPQAGNTTPTMRPDYESMMSGRVEDGYGRRSDFKGRQRQQRPKYGKGKPQKFGANEPRPNSRRYTHDKTKPVEPLKKKEAPKVNFQEHDFPVLGTGNTTPAASVTPSLRTTGSWANKFKTKNDPELSKPAPETLPEPVAIRAAAPLDVKLDQPVVKVHAATPVAKDNLNLPKRGWESVTKKASAGESGSESSPARNEDTLSFNGATTPSYENTRDNVSSDADSSNVEGSVKNSKQPSFAEILQAKQDRDKRKSDSEGERSKPVRVNTSGSFRVKTTGSGDRSNLRAKKLSQKKNGRGGSHQDTGLEWRKRNQATSA